MAAVSIVNRWKAFPRSGPAAASLHFVVLALVSATLLWLCGLAGLLAVARRVHVDVPQALAVKLPLLGSRPGLIIAGESRNAYGLDPALASDLLGERRGYAVNIAYDAGEPLATLGAAKLKPDVFRNADVVISVAPFNFNEGIRQAYTYPLNVAARLGTGELMWNFLPLRVGTLVRFIREAFASRLALLQGVHDGAAVPGYLGFAPLGGQKPPSRWVAHVGEHPHYQRFDLDGPRSRFMIDGLCDLATRVRRLTVLIPPWAPNYARADDPVWSSYDTKLVALVGEAARRCGFDLLDVQSVPGLTAAQFYDELHVNAAGVPAYTKFVIDNLRK